MEEKKEKWIKFFSVEILFALVVLAAILLFAFIADEAVYENEKSLDSAVFAFFGSITTHWLVTLMKVVTFFGSTAFLTPAYILLIGYYCKNKQFTMAAAIGIIAVTCNLLYSGLKVIFKRHRPDAPLISGVIDYSFPSGHSMSGFVFYSILIYVLWTFKINTAIKWCLSVFFALFAVLIGISRIVLRVHYPTDVLGAFCLGTVWVIISFWIVKRLNHRKSLSEKARI